MIHSLSSKSYRFAVGLALFAMFFGSGNLIFPLAIGYMAQDHWFIGTLGFLLTGALLPFLGIITMVVYKGDYMRFFNVLGKTGAFIFVFALLTAWIPFGSGPRCVVLSHVNVVSYLGIPLWLYSLLYCSLLYIICLKKSTALDILGYVLTPILLLSLAAVIYLGVESSPGFAPSPMSSWSVFWYSLFEGYQTQDLIASFFFASAIIEIISTNSKGSMSPVKAAFQSSIIGVVLLGSVYIGLIILSASGSQILTGVPKDALLSTLVREFLPPKLAFTGSLAVALACLTTSIALTLVYADFLQRNFFSGFKSNNIALLLTVVITFLFSLMGFEAISAVISPLMQIFYPCLIILIIWNLVINKWILKKT